LIYISAASAAPLHDAPAGQQLTSPFHLVGYGVSS
jgi:hypothetical protein